MSHGPRPPIPVLDCPRCLTSAPADEWREGFILGHVHEGRLESGDSPALFCSLACPGVSLLYDEVPGYDAWRVPDRRWIKEQHRDEVEAARRDRLPIPPPLPRVPPVVKDNDGTLVSSARGGDSKPSPRPSPQEA